MITIAITGGIGAGKSTVTSHLISKGYTVIDADRMSREMTSAGGKAIPYIIEHFGESFILEDGSLDRAAMRDLVFRNPAMKKILPLLFETHQESNYDQVWVVTADYEIRKERIMARDGIEPSIIDLIMDSQSEEERKVKSADVVFYNNGTVEELEAAVDKALGSL